MDVVASELRINNKVFLGLSTGEKVEHAIYGVHGKRIWISEYSSCHENDFEPIPLTEKWMQKLGFVTADYEVDQIVWDYNDSFAIVQDGVPPEVEPFVFEWEDGRDNRKTEIKYVHQLQNLYFALTGEELKIKEA